ncbi:tRNA (adenosine(37)-N6)-threonylcarbamoyltransferase complex ATPase subunit type 1 TsaE [bacterium]|nr:tRNA (adenosine(37)-N6)-threonylcarbamoyltransferase complex ATPase subunit type 1 TsaE [bacterium]
MNETVHISGTNYDLVHRAISQSVEQTVHFAAAWATTLQCGDTVAFYGGLGSGKTTFIRGIVAGLNSKDPVSSPTFTLVNEYTGRCPIYHVDLYRIDSTAALRDVGLEDYINAETICLVEWPEIAASFLPAGHRAVRLSMDFAQMGPEARLIEVLQQHDSRD